MNMFLIITFLALDITTSINGIPACGPNQQYFDCGPCEQICDREPQSCIAACRQPGCYCQKGYIRASPCNSSECVQPSQCPSKCRGNEVYNPCGGCDQICGQEPIFCTQDCSRPGCYCQKGYKRASKGRSDCVPEDNCPRNQCGPNEEYKCSCEKYCNELPVACFRCKSACYCKDGYKRPFRGGICIKESACIRSRQVGSSSSQNAGPGRGSSLTQNSGPRPQGPSSGMTQNAGQRPQRCRLNEVYRYCGCDQYCDKRPVCNSRICIPGCYCQEGYVRSFSRGICIPSNTCQQQQCGANEVFKKCRDCDQYCNKGQVGCAAVCTPGCSCLKGYKRSFSGGVCVPASICPWFKEKGSSSSQNAGPSRCNPNEVSKQCGCDQVCGKNPVICAQSTVWPQNCKPGCYCKDGFMRANDSKGSRCILLEQCQGPQQQCRDDEEYKCDCEQYCNEPPIFCFRCTNGCFCKNGYKRWFRGGFCIPISICPLLRGIGLPPTQNTGPRAQGTGLSLPQNGGPAECNPYEVFKQCGCDQVCGRNPVLCAQSTLVPYNCRPDCYCRDGLVRADNRIGSKCIKPEECPGRQKKCGDNEEYIICGGCDGYCNAGPIACAECLPACYCKKGYVRLSPGKQCVLSSNCPTKCGANEVFKNCGGCDQYCNKGPVSCPAVCSRGCYCKEGYKRSPRGDCVRTSVCEPQQQQCNVNEVFIYCGGCDQYCNEKPRICTSLACIPGCYCQKGYKRSFRGGICIEISVCPRILIGEDSFVKEDTQTQVQEESFNEDTAYRCGQNEVYYQCGVGQQCENYCGKGPTACAYCQPGCYCKRDYIRTGPDYGAACIPQNECPPNQDVSLDEIEETGESSNDQSGLESSNSGSRYGDIVTYEETDESFSDWGEYESSSSGSHSEDTVTYETEGTYESYGDFSEFESSYSGSFSEDESSSFVENAGSRSEYDGGSFAENSEANPSFDQGSQGPGYNCRPDEEFNACGVGPECEKYCGKGAEACAYCKRGCYCKKGTIRAGPSNTTRCVPENQCATAEKCFENEIYFQCGTACPANCENRNPVCTQNCVAGCFCKKGYIRRHADLQTYHNECIPVTQCPP